MSAPHSSEADADAAAKQSAVEKAIAMLTGEDEGRVCKDIPESACDEQPRNFGLNVAALSLTKSADGLIDPKLVLSWLLSTLGASSFFIGLLVPIREAGALLPQLFTAGALRRMPQRKWAWAVGSAVQGACAGGIGLAALALEGAAAGWVIVALLAILAVARSVCSVTYKDVLGKTVSKSRRGRATGLASSLSAVLVLVFGALLIFWGEGRMVLVIGGLLVAAAAWGFAAVLFTRLVEEEGATSGGANAFDEAKENFSLLWEDQQLRLFIAVRGLLIGTALAPPYMVALAAGDSGDSYRSLGLLVIASATAALTSSWVWGRYADKSSRNVLSVTGLVAGLALVLTIAANAAGLIGTLWALPLSLLILMVAYQGVRLGRSTHLVDMATEETRAAYTALSNTVIGVLLLAGGVFAALAQFAGEAAVLAVFAAMSFAAALLSRKLEEVQ